MEIGAGVVEGQTFPFGWKELNLYVSPCPYGITHSKLAPVAILVMYTANITRAIPYLAENNDIVAFSIKW